MTLLFFSFKEFIFFTLVLIFPFLKFQPGTKLNKDILLQNELLTIMPKEFYVANVVDARDNRTSIAWLVPVAGLKTDQTKLIHVDLQGGGLSSIKQFIDKNLPCNKSLRPVVVTLKKFKVIETVAAGKLVEGHIELKLSFELKNDDGNLHLADYNGSAVYSRTAGLPQEIEPTLRHVLVSGLLYLNTWMNSHAGNNIKLSKTVNIVFTNYTEKQEGDTIYYSLKRPLTWADFQSEISSSRYDAQVFPTFGYEEHNEIKKGIIIIRLSIKVCLPKSACWVKENSRNDYTLNHEQRHFDIAELAARHFKKTIMDEKIPANNFDGPINEDYLEAYREMSKLQKQYDNETSHGANQAVQQHWNERIDKELKTETN